MFKKLGIMVILASAYFVYSGQACAQNQPSPKPAAGANAGVDQDIQLLRQDIRSRRKQLIAANLKLSSEQAAKFWPLYDQYTAEQSKIGDQETSLIKEYSDQWGTMTDEQASSLIKRSVALDEEIAQLRTKYVPIFSKALPGQVVATFFQLDRWLQSALDVQLGSQIPLVQEQR